MQESTLFLWTRSEESGLHALELRMDKGPFAISPTNGFNVSAVEMVSRSLMRDPLFRDTSGILWLGGSAGLARGTPGSFETFVPPALKPPEQLRGVSALANGPNGSMLIGMGQGGRNIGLQEFKTIHWNSFPGNSFDGSTLQINNLLNDRSGLLWIGTVSQGLCVIREKR